MEKLSITGKQTKWAIGVFLALVVLFNSFNIIQSGDRGFLFTLGALENQIVSEGIVFKIPFIQSIEKITIQPMQLDYTVEVGSQGAITKDNQNIGMSGTVFYKYKLDRLVDMRRNYGEEKMKSIVEKTTSEGSKQQIGRYTIFDIAADQQKIRANTLEVIKDDLAIYPIEVTELKITNYDWSEAFEKQIEETMLQSQKVKQKEQELLIAEQEAQKKVKEAEAAKQANITSAEGEQIAAKLRAEAKALEGEGIRKFNESIRATRDIEMQLRQLDIELERVKKWNGQYVPNNMYGPIPFNSVGGIQPKQ